MPKRPARKVQKVAAAITIKPLAPSDYDGLVALWKASGLTYRPRGRDSRGAIAGQLKQPTAIFLKAVVAEGSGSRQPGAGTRGQTSKMVGAVLGTHDGRRGWINRLAVLPGYQKKGIGGALLDELERRLDRLGLLLVAVQVDRGNRRSLRFFKGLGYRLHDDIHYLSKRKGDWA